MPYASTCKKPYYYYYYYNYYFYYYSTTTTTTTTTATTTADGRRRGADHQGRNGAMDGEIGKAVSWTVTAKRRACPALGRAARWMVPWTVTAECRLRAALLGSLG